MTTLGQLVKQRRNVQSYCMAFVGDNNGNVSCADGLIYARWMNGEIIKVVHRGGPLIYGQGVIVERTNGSYWQVREVPQHDAQHEFPYADVVWVSRSRSPEVRTCSYCGSNSPDDMRGNCSACGAPRT